MYYFIEMVRRDELHEPASTSSTNPDPKLHPNPHPMPEPKPSPKPEVQAHPWPQHPQVLFNELHDQTVYIDRPQDAAATQIPFLSP